MFFYTTIKTDKDKLIKFCRLYNINWYILNEKYVSQGEQIYNRDIMTETLEELIHSPRKTALYVSMIFNKSSGINEMH